MTLRIVSLTEDIPRFKTSSRNLPLTIECARGATGDALSIAAKTDTTVPLQVYEVFGGEGASTDPAHIISACATRMPSRNMEYEICVTRKWFLSKQSSAFGLFQRCMYKF